ncbi:MAG: hypothetical protein P4M08_05745 [Oligoflexia bacterium]|nr:hypothetical protein [Oligoflexia bacterium]
MSATHPTKRETVHSLCKSIVTRLENHKSISFPVRLRQIVADEVFHLVGPFILTDEDLRDRTLAKIGAKASVLEDSQFTDSAQYKTAKSMVRQSFGDDELNGFYFQKPLKAVAETIVQYFMRSSHIDDVYETDEDLEHQIVEVVQKFNPSELH